MKEFFKSPKFPLISAIILLFFGIIDRNDREFFLSLAGAAFFWGALQLLEIFFGSGSGNDELR